MHAFRIAILIVAVAGVAAGDPVATSKLPASAVKTLAGCWQSADKRERWTFKPEGEGSSIVRDVADKTYQDRARIPRMVVLLPDAVTFGFDAAGRIHALRILFQIDHAALKAWFYSSHDGKSYGWTGSTATLQRCR